MERKPWHRTGEDRRVRGRAGQVARARRFARTDGLCERCLEEERSVLATVVNHKIPLAHGGPDTDENTENLCKRHDDEATAAQFGKDFEAIPMRHHHVADHQVGDLAPVESRNCRGTIGHVNSAPIFM